MRTTYPIAKIVAVKWNGKNALIAKKVFPTTNAEKTLAVVKTQNQTLSAIPAKEKTDGGFVKNVLQKRKHRAKVLVFGDRMNVESRKRIKKIRYVSRDKLKEINQKADG